MRIATLGCGSLIWDPRGLPLASEWSPGGPALPIEFSRISADGRLTLVIDPANGERVPTRYAESARTDLEDAICDLRNREGTVAKHIGFVDVVSSATRSNHAPTLEAIREWVRSHNFDAVIWTDLAGNFQEKTGNAFSAEAALHYLRSLPREATAKAREYIERAPAEVDTPIRRLAASLWLQKPDSQRQAPNNSPYLADDAWQAIQDRIDVCSTCLGETCFIPKLPPSSRPWNPVKPGRLLLISEAPPEHGGFWHLPDNGDPRTWDDLRAQVFRLLGPHGLVPDSSPHEIVALRIFMSVGPFLRSSPESVGAPVRTRVRK